MPLGPRIVLLAMQSGNCATRYDGSRHSSAQSWVQLGGGTQRSSGRSGGRHAASTAAPLASGVAHATEQLVRHECMHTPDVSLTPSMRPCPVATVQFHQPSQCDVQLGRQPPRQLSRVLSVMCAATSLHTPASHGGTYTSAAVALPTSAVTFTGGA